MERPKGSDDFIPAFIMAEFPGQFEQPFVCFGATITEKTSTGADQIDQPFGQAALQLIII